MPDQSFAAEERAILQEITAPFTTLPDDPVAIAGDVDFPVVLRGYDRVAVDAYVKRTSQLVADLQATRSPEAAMRRVTERMGQQISGIIQRAYARPRRSQPRHVPRQKTYSRSRVRRLRRLCPAGSGG